MELIGLVAVGVGLIIGLGAMGACIGVGIALWFTTANPFLAQLANLPK